MIKKLSEIVDEIKKEAVAKGKKKRLAVAAGEDPHTIEAVAKSVKEELVDAILVGNKKNIEKVAKEYNINPSIFTIIEEPDPVKATKKAVKLVREGEAEVLMKGLVDTAIYMKAILDKQEGLLPPGKLLTHVTLMEFPTYHKLLLVCDVAIIIQPTLEQKVQMIKYTIDIAKKLGIEKPKVAVISAVEKVNLKMPSSIEAAVLKTMGERGQFGDAHVDGPLALDVAVSKECANIKKLKGSPVAGDADILIFPNIEAGNIFFKTGTQLAKAKLAAIVVGALAPCVLTSRADTEESKFYSIALATLISERR